LHYGIGGDETSDVGIVHPRARRDETQAELLFMPGEANAHVIGTAVSTAPERLILTLWGFIARFSRRDSINGSQMVAMQVVCARFGAGIDRNLGNYALIIRNAKP
jgi:hypothetical protein